MENERRRMTVSWRRLHKDALFLSLQGKRMTERQIRELVKKYTSIGMATSRKAGYSPHKLRATAATSLIGRGNSIFDVQALMDHEQVTTTQLYAAHKMNVKRDLVNDMEWELEKERKEIAIMRRSVVLSLTVMFAASAVAAAPVSFALDGEGNDSDGYAESYDEYENDDQQQQQYVEKDTSWFDYYDQQDTYEISTEADLLGLASLVNEQQVDKWKPTRLENFEGITFVLTRDIKLTSSDWSPIGTGGASYFAGIFDGNGHTISGLEIDIESGSAGLFGYLVGTVKDLTVEGNISSGDGNCGGIAGILADTGQITGCSANVSVSGRDKVGGIAGYNDGEIESCMNYGSISGAYKVGGIVGENWGGTVNMCGNRGDIDTRPEEV